MGIDSILQQNMQNTGIAGINQLAGNAMYPQSQQVNTQFATPSQMPTSAEVVRSDYDAVTNPYNGEPTRGFAEGGDVEDSQQLEPAPEVVDYKDQIAQLYQGVLGRSPDEGAKGWEDLLSAGYGIDEVARQIGASAEAKNKTIAGLSEELRANDPNDFAGSVAQLYASALGRTPDAASLEANVNLLNRNPDAFAWLADTVTKSPEARAYAEKSGVDLDKAYAGVVGNFKHFTPTPKQGGIGGFFQKVGPFLPLALAGGALAAPYLAGAAGAGAAGAGAAGAGAAAAGTAAAGAAAASTTPAWMIAAGKGAAIGAAMGGGSAAMTGGDVGQGIIRGGITGAVGGGAGSAMGGGFMGNVAGGALAGGTGSALRGGNIAQGASMGALGGAINTGINQLGMPSEANQFAKFTAKPLIMSEIGRTLYGGASSNIPGSTAGTYGGGISAMPSGPYGAFNPGINFGAGATGLAGLGMPNIAQNTNPFAAQYSMPRIQLSKLSEFDGYAEGGLATGGIAALGSYSDGGRLLKGPGDGMSDDIPAKIGNSQPARLADGEFVVPADVVSHLGNGSTDAGAKQLYKMLDKIRHARTGNKKQGKQINPSKFLP
jgi:hypothetical protein